MVESRDIELNIESSMKNCQTSLMINFFILVFLILFLLLICYYYYHACMVTLGDNGFLFLILFSFSPNNRMRAMWMLSTWRKMLMVS